jgi:GNAT superfamily N-acetyltransferase
MTPPATALAASPASADKGRSQRPIPGATVRCCTVPSPVIRIATSIDGPAMAGLRRTWTAEDHGDVEDEGFQARFLDWYERESARRITWLAEVSGEPVGMMNLAIFERMPRPGREAGTWAYLANAFVLEPHRDQGIGALLLSALLADADGRGYVRIVLRPSERAIPFYLRAGFTPDGGFLVRHATRSPTRPAPGAIGS